MCTNVFVVVIVEFQRHEIIFLVFINDPSCFSEYKLSR